MKDILSRKDPLPPTTSSLPLSSSSAAAAAPINASDGQSQPVRLLNGSGVGGHDTGAMGIKQPFTATNNGQKLSAFLPNASAAAAAASSSPTATAATTATAAAAATPKRRSMKRPAQSSVMLQDPPPSAAAPPTASASSQTAAPASSALPDANVFLSISNAGSHPTAKQALSSAQLGDPQQLPTHFTTQPAAALIGCNHHAGVQPLYAPQPIGPPSVPPAPPAPLSGKSTPRQPAKKRLEARTPTIDELGVPSAFKVLHDTPFTPVLGRSVNSGQPTSLSQTPVSATISSTQPSMEVAGGGGVGAVQGVKSSSKPEEDEDEEMKTIFAGPVARRHHSTTHQPPLSGIPYVDYKQLHERLQHHGVAINGTAGAMDSANSLFFRSTPGGNVKRCASASALPSLSPGPLMVHGGQVDPSDLCQMPALVPAVPGFSSPPPPRLTPGGATGRQSKPPLFDRDTPGLRNLASRFRDSPIFHTHPDILDVLVSLAQEYGVQSNRAGSSCSRPQSQHYLRRSLFPGTDSPSPAGLPLNMLNSSGGLVGASDLGDSQQHPAPPPPPLSFTSTANSAFTDLSPRVVVEVMNPPPPASTADFN
uniref:Sister chromatid cohesion protein n=1 Tax=Mesocestoides corti TaxID=53468 RepID=A0A5K3FPM8_MESCO